MSEASREDPSTNAPELGVPASVERYLIFDEIGVGGMASVHLGMLTGAVGFRRIVALKQLHSRFIHDPDFVAQFINEARLAARIHHANVVQTLDVVWTGTQLMLVMEYVDGDTLNRVLRSAVERKQQVPIEIACSMVAGVLHGLHAAHEVKDEEGVPLDIIHRDVSPQNILIGRDGSARVLDFGVAKALAQSPNTQSGLLKGKFGYMAPEQILRGNVDRRADVFAAGVVLWETLTCRRLFQASKNIEQAMSRVVAAEIPSPSSYRDDIPPRLDAIVMKAMDRDAERRFQSAEELAVALEGIGAASPHLVKTWFGPLASAELAQRAALIRNINKRYGPPGRSTPHPNSLADEARAALASSLDEDSRRKASYGDGPPSRRAGSGTLPPGRMAPPSGPHPSHGSRHSNTSLSQTLPSRVAADAGPGSSSARRSGRYSLEALVTLAKPKARTLPPRRSPSRPVLLLDEMPTTGGHLVGVPALEFWHDPRLRHWARNVGGALLAFVLFMSTWVTAIGWNDQPPTSEHLRARREASLAAAREANASTPPPSAAGSERVHGAESAPPLRELSSRSESLRPSHPAAALRGKEPEPTDPPAVERRNPRELRLTR